jgi:hypothetical protein
MENWEPLVDFMTIVFGVQSGGVLKQATDYL